MTIRRDFANFCHWVHLARHDSPCTPSYYSVPQAIFEVLRAKRLTTQFLRKWNGAVLADGSNIGHSSTWSLSRSPRAFKSCT